MLLKHILAKMSRWEKASYNYLCLEATSLEMANVPILFRATNFHGYLKESPKSLRYSVDSLSIRGGMRKTRNFSSFSYRSLFSRLDMNIILFVDYKIINKTDSLPRSFF